MSDESLRQWLAQGLLGTIDVHFATFLARLDPGPSEMVLLAAALTSRATREGHVCLMLQDVAGRPLTGGRPGNGSFRLPDLHSWRSALWDSKVVGKPGDYLPLILDRQDRLYLHRYWQYQHRLVNWLRQPMDRKCRPAELTGLKSTLNRLFPPGDESIDWQKMAAAVAWLRKFCVISGGPGTGKTTTVARVLALFTERSKTELIVKLLAPTGKAAARLQEAIREAKAGLDVSPEVVYAIPEEASTIHRLLGAGPHSSRFRHGAGNPLVADLVIVDEASMVDLALMSRLVQALPPRAGLVLLGDKDQLASVEAGAVLGDLCAARDLACFTESFGNTLQKITGDQVKPAPEFSAETSLLDSLVELKKNYRFAGGTGIGVLSDAVKQGNGARALQLLERESHDSTVWQDLPASDHLAGRLVASLGERLASYLAAEDIGSLFRAFNSFRVLCALRRGPFGVEAVNANLEQCLSRRGLLHRTGIWYPRRPVLITRNDYNLQLYNGDVGIAFGDDREAGNLRVFFEGLDGSFRSFHPLRLPAHETVFAMTVHKSQGSEFDCVHLILPDRESPVLTRELVYTGITRGRRQVTVWGNRAVFRNGVSRKIERSSGLRDALWGSGLGPR